MQTITCSKCGVGKDQGSYTLKQQSLGVCALCLPCEIVALVPGPLPPYSPPKNPNMLLNAMQKVNGNVIELSEDELLKHIQNSIANFEKVLTDNGLKNEFEEREESFVKKIGDKNPVALAKAVILGILHLNRSHTEAEPCFENASTLTSQDIRRLAEPRMIQAARKHLGFHSDVFLPDDILSFLAEIRYVITGSWVISPHDTHEKKLYYLCFGELFMPHINSSQK